MQVEMGIAAGAVIYSVSSLTQQIKEVLEHEWGLITIRGEISNLRPAASGHIYFSLKDASATISAAIFKNSLGRLKNLRMENGLEVICRGRLSVYPPRGSYQIIIESMEPVGAGNLQAKFEELKKKLLAEGLFSEERKRPLPAMPQKIAVITSPTGAAIRDVLSVLSRRHAGVSVVIIPSLVQGDGAESELIRAINLANDPRLRADVILLTRGGGSLEDLWCFNSEALAREIFSSRLPIVSAVGHEIDFTIADFVADLRAATPSAAAELLVQEQEILLEQVLDQRDRLVYFARSLLNKYQMLLESTLAKLKNPRDRITELRLRYDEWSERLIQAMWNKIQSYKVKNWPELLQNAVCQSIKDRRELLKQLEASLAALSPLAVLDRGYSLVYNNHGDLLKTAEAAPPGTWIKVRLARGEIAAEVCKRWPR